VDLADIEGFPVEMDHDYQFIGEITQVARALFAAGDVAGILQQVVELATGTIEGCDFAGIFYAPRTLTAVTRICTDPIVEAVDKMQERTGQGPCLDAAAEGGTFYAEDVTLDDRWPLFGAAAAAMGIRSVIAFQVSSGEGSGALNLYAKYPKAFGVIDRGKGLVLATFAGMAISAAKGHEHELQLIDSLNTALATREVIGQAQGILMERERVGANEAFDILRRASQHLNRKLREVAQELVDTGERPETGATAPPRADP